MLSHYEFLMLSAIYDERPYIANPSKVPKPINVEKTFRELLPHLVELGFIRVEGEDIVKLRTGQVMWEIAKAHYEATGEMLK